MLVPASPVPELYDLQNTDSSGHYLFEVSAPPLLPVHHVMEDRDHDVPQVRLGNQGHLQERTYHRRDEVQLVLTWREMEVAGEKERDQLRSPERRARIQRRDTGRERECDCVVPKFCHMLKISQPIITLMSPYLYNEITPESARSEQGQTQEGKSEES